MDDGELYLAMDNFKQPPSPSPLYNTRRHSEIPSHSSNFDSMVHSLQGCGINQPTRPRTNYPHVILRNGPSQPNASYPKYPHVEHEQPPPRPPSKYLPTDQEQPPPRPAKPTFNDELNSRMAMRHPANEEPPPRPYKPPASEGGFLSALSQREQLGHSPPANYGGSPVDRAPSHYPAPYRQPPTLEQPPPVHPRFEQEDSELYLKIDTPGIESNQILEATFHTPHNVNEGYDPNHMLTKHYPPAPQSTGLGNVPNFPNKSSDISFHDHTVNHEHWSRSSPMDQISPSPTHSHISHRSPMPSPIGPPSRKSSSKSNGPEIPRRVGSKDSQGSSSSGENADVEKHDHQTRKMFQNFQNQFDDHTFRGPAALPAVAPSMTVSSALAEKALPSMKKQQPVAAPRRTSGPETSSPRSTSKNVDDQVWYKNVTRSKAMEEIEQEKQDGCFIVRPGKGPNKPYSLTVCSDGALYNLYIRRREDGNYALGSEKENERSFPNAVDLINYFQDTPLVLADNRGSVTLTGPPT